MVIQQYIQIMLCCVVRDWQGGTTHFDVFWVLCKEYFIEQNIVILKYSNIHDNVDRCWNNVGIVYRAGRKYDKFQVTKYRRLKLLHIYSMTKYDIFSTHPITLVKLEKSQTPFVDKKKSQFITFMTSDIFSLFFFISVNHEQHISSSLRFYKSIWILTEAIKWTHFLLLVNPFRVCCVLVFRI